MVDVREKIDRLIEKLQQMNNILLKISEPDQKLVDEWENTIRQLYQTMKQALIDAGKTYLVDHLRRCWTCDQKGKLESVYTAGIIFCKNTECQEYFYYWSMCKTLYGDIPEKIFNQVKEEIIKENILYA